MSERKETEEEEEVVGVLGSGPQLCEIVPEGLPETEPDLCSSVFHVQIQRGR